MKSTICLMVCVILITGLLAACGGAGDSGGAGAGSTQPAGAAETGDSYTMKISVSPPDTNPIAIGVHYLAEIVEERSGGRIKTEVFTGYSMTSSNEDQADYTMNNNIQMSVTVNSTLVGLGQNLDAWYIFDYPFMFDDADEVYRFADGDPIYTEMCDALKSATGLRAYPPYSQGLIKLGVKVDPQTPQDLSGAKIRTTTSQLMQEMITSWTAAPTPMGWGEVFTGLQQGTVDGVCTSTGMFESDKLYEVVDYMACVNPCPMLHVPIVNEAWFQSLPEDLKEIVDTCMYDYIDYERQLQDAAEEEIKQLMRDNGMVVVEYSAEAIQPFKESSAYILEEYAHLAGEELVKQVRESLGK